jgi:transposase, IS30 family
MPSHFSLEEREIIVRMMHDGSSQTEIAERLGRSKGTISRELKRNRSRNGYRPMLFRIPSGSATEVM